MLKGYVVGGEEVRAAFDKMPEQFQAGLVKGITRAVIMVQRRTKEKLSDDVLRVKTGRLRRSITQAVNSSAGRVEGIVGTNVSYARPHEFGFNGNVTVREHLRRAKSGKESMIRSHSRHMVIPERSFLRSSLKELDADVRAEIKASITQHFRKAVGLVD